MIIISSQEQEALEQVAHAKLAEFVNSRMQQYFVYIDDRIKAEVGSASRLVDKQMCVWLDSIIWVDSGLRMDSLYVESLYNSALYNKGWLCISFSENCFEFFPRRTEEHSG